MTNSYFIQTILLLLACLIPSPYSLFILIGLLPLLCRNYLRYSVIIFVLGVSSYLWLKATLLFVIFVFFISGMSSSHFLVPIRYKARLYYFLFFVLNSFLFLAIGILTEKQLSSNSLQILMTVQLYEYILVPAVIILLILRWRLACTDFLHALSISSLMITLTQIISTDSFSDLTNASDQILLVTLPPILLIASLFHGSGFLILLNSASTSLMLYLSQSSSFYLSSSSLAMPILFLVAWPILKLLNSTHVLLNLKLRNLAKMPKPFIFKSIFVALLAFTIIVPLSQFSFTAINSNRIRMAYLAFNPYSLAQLDTIYVRYASAINALSRNAYTTVVGSGAFSYIYNNKPMPLLPYPIKTDPESAFSNEEFKSGIFLRLHNFARGALHYGLIYPFIVFCIYRKHPPYITAFFMTISFWIPSIPVLFFA